MSNETSGHLDPHAIYFTTRRTKKGWVAEKLYLNAQGELVRTRLCVPGFHASAIDAFRISVHKYWDTMTRRPPPASEL